jgi:hypothetical protein
MPDKPYEQANRIIFFLLPDLNFQGDATTFDGFKGRSVSTFVMPSSNEESKARVDLKIGPF